MPNEGRVGGEVSADDAPKRSRKERRAEKRRVHEAQTKAKVIDKANDKQAKGRNKMDKTEKKRKKGKEKRK